MHLLEMVNKLLFHGFIIFLFKAKSFLNILFQNKTALRHSVTIVSKLLNVKAFISLLQKCILFQKILIKLYMSLSFK